MSWSLRSSRDNEGGEEGVGLCTVTVSEEELWSGLRDEEECNEEDVDGGDG